MNKIAIVCPRSPRESYAGIENYVLNLSKALDKKFDIEIFCTAESPLKGAMLGRAKLKEFKEDHLPFGIKYYSNELIKELKKSNAKIIHATGYNTLAPLMAIMAKKHSQKLIITLGSSKSSSRIRGIMEKAYLLGLKCKKKKIDYIIALSKFEKNQFSGEFKNIPFAIIPIASKSKTDFTEKKLKKQIISVGRLVKNKGFHYAIDAFNELNKLDNEFKLILVGDGQYKNKLMDKVKKLGLKNSVIFFGNVGQEKHYKIIEMLKESTAFIFLSNYESQCVAAIESICAKTPTILSNKSVFPEFEKAGLAYCFSEKDSKKIAEKLFEINKNRKKFLPKKKNIDDFYLIISAKEMAKLTSSIYLYLLGNKKLVAK